MAPPRLTPGKCQIFSKVFWLPEMIYLKLCDEKTNSIRTNNKEIGGICRPFEIIPTYSNTGVIPMALNTKLGKRFT